VSLAGRIEEIELAEILHFLALNSRTGKLTLSRRDAHGTIVMRLGRVLYAASSSIRETLGSLLVCRGLVNPTALAGALERQHVAADHRKLGQLLVESGAITDAQLRDALWQQTALVVQELCGWRSGYFRFEIMPVASSGDIGVDVEDLVVAAGIPTDQILLEAMTRIDEAPPAEHAPDALDVVASTRAPALRGEVTAGLLRRAAGVVRRGLLMAVRTDEVQGLGHVGFGATDEPDAACRIRVPLGQPSAIADAVERRRTWTGRLAPTPADEALLDALGGLRPGDALVVPMLLHDRTGLLFYGDDAADGQPLGDASELEWALLEAGLAMEQDMLEQRFRDFERARGYRP
jgi:hypothetical protein